MATAIEATAAIVQLQQRPQRQQSVEVSLIQFSSRSMYKIVVNFTHKCILYIAQPYTHSAVLCRILYGIPPLKEHQSRTHLNTQKNNMCVFFLPVIVLYPCCTIYMCIGFDEPISENENENENAFQEQKKPCFYFCVCTLPHVCNLPK